MNQVTILKARIKRLEEALVPLARLHEELNEDSQVMWVYAGKLIHPVNLDITSRNNVDFAFTRDEILQAAKLLKLK